MVSLDNLMLIISTHFAGALMCIGAILTFFYAKKQKYPLVYLFSLNWALQSSVWFLVGSAHYFYSTMLMSIAFVIQCIGIFILIVFLDLIEKERINTIQIIVLIIIEMLYLVFTFLPGGMEITPGYGVHIIGLLRIFQILTLIMYFFLYFFWSFKTWKQAPNEIKSETQLLLLGSLLFSVVALSFYMLGSVVKIFNSIGFMIHSIGAIITIIAIRKDPKIIYILPFRAYKILVFETREGITLFEYEWVKEKKMYTGLFTGILQAIGTALDETLDKGALREIKLDQAILIIHHNASVRIASVLIASKSSQSLRQGLKLFNDQFITKYSKELEKFNITSQFNDAIEIVNKVFEFVPNYK